jgi:hypothetical protein
LEPLEANPRIRSRKAAGVISMGEKREELEFRLTMGLKKIDGR